MLTTSATRRHASRSAWPRRSGRSSCRPPVPLARCLGALTWGLTSSGGKSNPGVLQADQACAKAAPPCVVPPASAGAVVAGEVVLVVNTVSGVIHCTKGHVEGSPVGSLRTACGWAFGRSGLGRICLTASEGSALCRLSLPWTHCSCAGRSKGAGWRGWRECARPCGPFPYENVGRLAGGWDVGAGEEEACYTSCW